MVCLQGVKGFREEFVLKGNNTFRKLSGLVLAGMMSMSVASAEVAIPTDASVPNLSRERRFIIVGVSFLDKSGD